MSLIVTAKLIKSTQHADLAPHRKQFAERKDDWEQAIDISGLGNEALSEIVDLAGVQSKLGRAIAAIVDARKGEFSKPVPNFLAFEGVLKNFLEHDVKDGWIYVTGEDGKIYPELVTSVRYSPGEHRNPNPVVKLSTMSYGRNTERGTARITNGTNSYYFHPVDVARRRVADILAARGIYKETTELRVAYDATMEHFRKTVEPGFAEQFVFTGNVDFYEDRHYERRGTGFSNRKIINDLAPLDYGPYGQFVEVDLTHEGDFDKDLPEEGQNRAVPQHPLVRVFDLKTLEFYWVHADFLTAYTYNPSLRDKLILPQSHYDLLDVLTSDLSAFMGDFIDGKTAGNVILCKGIPGTGKTATSEIYAEIIKRPLLSVRTGTLGTTAAGIKDKLELVINWAKRWNCVLQLDEADVFVAKRNNNIEQNAICAEFLRTLEYTDTLMFLTTNRPDDIDEAIVSRCIAIIQYDPPTADDAKKIWTGMGDHFGAKIDTNDIGRLVHLFPSAVGRDIKMLLSLVLRLTKGQKPSIDDFRKSAMFRAVEINKDALKEDALP